MNPLKACKAKSKYREAASTPPGRAIEQKGRYTIMDTKVIRPADLNVDECRMIERLRERPALLPIALDYLKGKIPFEAASKAAREINAALE